MIRKINIALLLLIAGTTQAMDTPTKVNVLQQAQAALAQLTVPAQVNAAQPANFDATIKAVQAAAANMPEEHFIFIKQNLQTLASAAAQWYTANATQDELQKGQKLLENTKELINQRLRENGVQIPRNRSAASQPAPTPARNQMDTAAKVNVLQQAQAALAQLTVPAQINVAQPANFDATIKAVQAAAANMPEEYFIFIKQNLQTLASAAAQWYTANVTQDELQKGQKLLENTKELINQRLRENGVQIPRNRPVNQSASAPAQMPMDNATKINLLQQAQAALNQLSVPTQRNAAQPANFDATIKALNSAAESFPPSLLGIKQNLETLVSIAQKHWYANPSEQQLQAGQKRLEFTKELINKRLQELTTPQPVPSPVAVQTTVNVIPLQQALRILNHLTVPVQINATKPADFDSTIEALNTVATNMQGFPIVKRNLQKLVSLSAQWYTSHITPQELQEAQRVLEYAKQLVNQRLEENVAPENE